MPSSVHTDTVELTSSSRIVHDEALRDVAHTFHERVQRFARPDVEVGLLLPGDIESEEAGSDAPLPSLLRLRLDPSAAASARTTRGVRADGKDADRERYEISADAEGITIRAPHPEGIHRALTPFVLLIAQATDEDGDRWRVSVPDLPVADAPAFAWRGLNLDVARWYAPAEVIERVIDLLDLYRMNVLHLHLTDDQGWRMPIYGWDRLTAERPHYSRGQFQRIVEYAQQRFITVVPEFDVPGHSTAAMNAYPELGDPGVSNCLDVDNDSTWGFVDSVLEELGSVTPSAFLHIGGDEAFQISADAHAAFVARARSAVHAQGRGAIGWQEAARGGLGESDIVQYWIESDKLDQLITADGVVSAAERAGADLFEFYSRAVDDIRTAVDAGAGVLLSPVGTAYLDRGYAEPPSAAADLDRWNRLRHPMYPPARISEYAEWDIADHAERIGAGAATVGIEICLWSETLESAEDLFFLLLPRLPIISDRAWSGEGDVDPGTAIDSLAGHRALWARIDAAGFWPAGAAMMD